MRISQSGKASLECGGPKAEEPLGVRARHRFDLEDYE